MQDLIGKKTPDGWYLEGVATFPADHTGGYFSQCFHVTRDGQKAFLKALDLDKFNIFELMSFFPEFQYEQATLAICRDNGMSRVVLPLLSADSLPDSSAQAVARHHAQGLHLRAETGVDKALDGRRPVCQIWHLTRRDRVHRESRASDGADQRPVWRGRY